MKIKVVECNDPKSCIKCIQVCLFKILVLKPAGTKKLSDHSKSWKIIPIFKDYCNGCMKCVEVCPEKCINIDF